MKKFNPQCVADMKDPKCHFYVRIYEKSIYNNTEKVDDDVVIVNKGFEADFIEEVEARFIEWSGGDYRISFPFDGPGSQKAYYTDEKRLDIWYNDEIKFKEWSKGYIFVLVIKVEKDFKSVCV